MKAITSGPVGDRYHATLRWTGQDLEVSWRPDKPRDLTPCELDDYRRLRRDLMQQLADALGAPVAIAEIAPDGRVVPDVVSPRIRQ